MVVMNVMLMVVMMMMMIMVGCFVVGQLID